MKLVNANTVGVAVSWGPASAAREDDNLSLIQYDASLGKGVFTKVKELSVLFSNICVYQTRA